MTPVSIRQEIMTPFFVLPASSKFFLRYRRKTYRGALEAEHGPQAYSENH